MLPDVTLNRLRTGAIASVTALSLALASATPTLALDKKERALLGVLAAAAIVGVLANDAARKKRERQGTYEAPRYDDDPHYPPRYDAPRYEPQPYYGNATAAFTEFSPASRRAIQSRLRAYGYYRGPIDGAYGPATRRAIEAYARDTGNDDLLATRNGTVTLLNGLLA